jgi:hypothetical protein
LRIIGEDLDVEALLQMKLFEPSSIFRRGEPRRRSQPDGERQTNSGICVTVSEAEWSDLPRQVEDAMQFLAKHETALRRAARLPGLSWFVLDFPSELRIGSDDVVVQTDCFPAPLLRAAGELGLGMELTTYG